MASDRKNVAERLDRSSPLNATGCSFFGSPTVWSLLTGGISGAAEYTGNPNITALIASIGGALSYFWAGALTPKNEADRDFFIRRIDGELRKIAANLALSTDTVTILENGNTQVQKEGYYLYAQNDEINAIVVKSGIERHFSLGYIHHPDNFILRLIDWENIEGDALIIDERLGLLLSSLVENHPDYPKEDKIEAIQANPNLSRDYYLSGINFPSASVMLLQLAALGLCIFELVEYSKNLSNADQSSAENEALSSQYLLAASIIKMSSAISYWFLRKYEDTGAEQKSEQYRKSLEDYAHAKTEKGRAKENTWIESMWIIADCKGKIDRLDQIKATIIGVLREIEGLGEKDAVPPGTLERIESSANEFKRILNEISGESTSAKINTFARTAEDNIDIFMDAYTRDAVYAKELFTSASESAKKAVLEIAKAELQMKQKPSVTVTMAP